MKKKEVLIGLVVVLRVDLIIAKILKKPKKT
jgi:hypothetical protein